MCVNVCVCVSLSACVELHTDLTPLHSCTFASIVSRHVMCTQVVPQNRVAFVMVAERR